MARSIGFLATLAVVSALLWPAFPANAQQVPFFVIVHPDNDADMLSPQAISDIFLKKKTQWDEKLAALPVDLPPVSALRKAFSEEIHGKSVEEILNYWKKTEAAGGPEAPPIVPDQKAVIEFVRTNPGAIGYVSTTAPFGDVNIIALVNPPVVIKKVPPKYTDKAVRYREQGTVVLRLQIDEEGRVEDVTVVEGLKYGLTEQAIRAVKRWRFQPATSGGMPVSAEIDVSVKFGL